MRKCVLVIVLVGAAFSGGAFVNGPGLQWAQTKVFRSLGLNYSGEITSVDVKPVPNAETGADDPGLVKPERDSVPGPVAPPPSLVTENNSAQDDAPNPPSPTRPSPKSNVNLSQSPIPERPKSLPALEQPLTRADPPLEPPASDPDVKPASVLPSPANSHPDTNLAPAILGTLAGLLPSDPSPSASASVPPPSSPPKSVGAAHKPTAEGNEDWMILDRKMQSLGVSRYSVEGEPGGRVLFSCLIPVAGRQAVTQRFEAEGDDLIQAARAALRRIALWRATQPSTP